MYDFDFTSTLYILTKSKAYFLCSLRYCEKKRLTEINDQTTFTEKSWRQIHSEPGDKIPVINQNGERWAGDYDCENFSQRFSDQYVYPNADTCFLRSLETRLNLTDRGTEKYDSTYFASHFPFRYQVSSMFSELH